MSDEPKVLKTITEADLETGLRGVPVGYCTTSFVDPEQGLHYVGHPIPDIAYRDPEEVIFLLLHKRWPEGGELDAFKAEIRKRQHVDPRVLRSMEALPHRGHPMKWFLHAINTMGMFSGTGDFYEDCLRLIAQVPVVTAAIYRVREEWGDPIPPSDDLGYMQNFVHMLGVPGFDVNQNDKLFKLMRVFNVLHFDHGGGNLSTFVGKAVASGLADMFESITGAMCGLAGPRHGKANQECLTFVSECIHAVGGDLSESAVREMIERRLENKQLIFGFGHAVLRVEDPRATVLVGLGEDLAPDDRYFR
ncbi:MAG: citrate synthase, partial [Planctomycetota bacterium]|nr:citrate synthase [Planctomycetota bacterium]